MNLLDLRALSELHLRYGVALVFALLFLVRLSMRPALTVGMRRRGSETMWYLPLYVWGLASVWHAFSWWFLEARMGIAPNEFYFVMRELVCTVAAFIIILLSGVFAQWRAWSHGLLPQAPSSMPFPVVAAVAGVAVAWGGLVAIIGGQFWFTPPPQ